MTFTWQKRSDGYYLEDTNGGGRMADFRELQFIEEITRLRAEIERLEREREEIIRSRDMYHDLSSLLQAEIERKFEALRKIAYPVISLQDEAENNGYKLDGRAAVELIREPGYYTDIAKQALQNKE